MTCAPTLAQFATADTPNFTPTESQISQAIEQLKADPNLAREQKIKRLKWANERPSQRTTSLPEWVAEFFRWLAESIRLLMWLGIATLVAMLAVLIVRQLRQIERRGRTEPLAEAPTHVHDLDIRPETLPDHIGAAALQLWEQGEHRGSLSLLYRGLLSRLVHAHEVPIKASSTEGACLELTQRHLAQQPASYAQQLIRVWQRAVYGGRDPDLEEVRALCLGFDRELGMSPSQAAST